MCRRNTQPAWIVHQRKSYRYQICLIHIIGTDEGSIQLEVQKPSPPPSKTGFPPEGVGASGGQNDRRDGLQAGHVLVFIECRVLSATNEDLSDAHSSGASSVIKCKPG